MVWFANTLWCDGCGVEISWAPLEIGDQAYCCRSCTRGERCPCGEILEDYPAEPNRQRQDIPLEYS